MVTPIGRAELLLERPISDMPQRSADEAVAGGDAAEPAAEASITS